MTSTRIVVYPGTFDPITYGHIDIIERGLDLFDQLIIAITTAGSKTPLLSLDKRCSLIKQLFDKQPRIKIIRFSGLLVDFMQQHNSRFVLRGIRNHTDMQYEFQLATMNQSMKKDMETVFLKASPKLAHISSTFVRDIAVNLTPNTLADLNNYIPSIITNALNT